MLTLAINCCINYVGHCNTRNWGKQFSRRKDGRPTRLQDMCDHESDSGNDLLVVRHDACLAVQQKKILECRHCYRTIF